MIRPQPKPTKRIQARKPLQTHARLERRTPMPKASKPIPRTWMRKATSRRVKNKTAIESAFTAYLHRPGAVCVGAGLIPGHVCDLSVPLQQAHARSVAHLNTGTGLKAKDIWSVTACVLLHDQFDGRRPPGPFAGMTKFEKFAWIMARISETHAAYVAQGGVFT